MAVTVTLTRVIHGAAGAITFLFSDGTGQEFASVDAAREYAEGFGNDAGLARALLIGRFLAIQPGAENAAVIEGKRLTLDLSQVNAVRVI